MVQVLCNTNFLNAQHEKISDSMVLLLVLEDNVWYTNYCLIYTGPMIMQLNKIKQLKDQWYMYCTWYCATGGFVKLKMESFDIL